MAKGLPVPANPTPENWQIVPLRVPNDAEWRGIVKGLLFSPCYGYWWKKSSGDWESAKDTACEIASGFNMTTFCEEMIKCIQSNSGVQSALDERIEEHIKSNPNHVLGQGTSAINGCQPDVIFGSATQIVNSIDQFIIDALEIIEVATNFVEVLSDWGGAIPVVGGVIDAVLSTMEAIVSDNALENYRANMTQGLRDQYRCDIFCLFIENDCTVTARMLLEYFGGRALAIDFDTVIDILTYFLAGTWSGSQWVDIMFFLAVGMVATNDGIGFFDLSSTYSLDQMIGLGARNPSSEWEIICDECDSEWSYTFDFTTTDGGFISRVAGLSVRTGQGWIALASQTFAFHEAGCKRNIDLSSSTIEVFEVEYYSDFPKDHIAPYTWRANLDGVNYDIPSTTGNQTFVVDSLSVSGGNPEFNVFLHFDGSLPLNACRIVSVTFRGTGTNPFLP